MNGVERIAAQFESWQRLARAVLVLHERQRPHQVADGGQRLPKLAANCAEHVGDLIRAGGQQVEVARVGVDRVRSLVERLADLTGLK